MTTEEARDAGRPKGSSDLSPDDLKIILEKVRQGVKPYRATMLAGFSKQAYYDWEKCAAKGEMPYAQAVRAIEMAEAEFLAALETDYGFASRTDWKAADKMLEKRDRQNYGAKIEVTAKDGDVAEMSREELLAIAYGKAEAANG